MAGNGDPGPPATSCHVRNPEVSFNTLEEFERTRLKVQEETGSTYIKLQKTSANFDEKSELSYFVFARIEWLTKQRFGEYYVMFKLKNNSNCEDVPF